jgi:hypothetical protein
MREICTSGSMSGEWKRSVGRKAPSHRASPRLYPYSSFRACTVGNGGLARIFAFTICEDCQADGRIAVYWDAGAN